MKKIVSIFIVAFIICTLCLPFTAFAKDAPTSGYCGEDYGNIGWSINDDHTVLTFTGHDKMKKYGYYSNTVPWWPYHDTVKTLILPAEITYISEYAFCYFTALENVFIPSNNVSLGYESFYGCSSLKNLAIGTAEGTASTSINIGAESFEQCKNLENVFISRSLKKVDYDGFEQCYALKNFYFGGVAQDYEKNVTIDKGKDNGNRYLTDATRKYRYEIWNKWLYEGDDYWVEPGISWPFSDAPFNIRKTDFGKLRAYLHDDKTYWLFMPDGSRAHEKPIEYTYDDTSYRATIPDGTVISGTFTGWGSDGLHHWRVLPNGEKANITFHSCKEDVCSICNTKLQASYLDKDGKTVKTSNAKEINAGTTKLTGGEYIAYGKVSLSRRLEVNENSTIVLVDGCELNINGGIHVPAGKTLTICAQSTDANKMGSLNIPSAPEKCAGIGTNGEENASHIVIGGGRIKVTGGGWGAGIGSGYCSKSIVDIYNGIIEAHGVDRGSGIGSGGLSRSDCLVNIYNGNIKAWGGDNAAGIGGSERSHFKVNIYNGTVEAWGGNRGSGIGSGADSGGGAVYISKSANVTGHGATWCSDIDNLQNIPVTGSIISSGNLWIVIVGAVVILGGIAATIIVKKKRKHVGQDS